MELILICIFSCIGILWLLFVIIGITAHDVRLIRQDREYRRHTQARRWRKRPLVSIVYDDVPTQKSLSSIHSNQYSNLQIINSSHVVIGEIIVHLSADTVINRTAIRSAVRQYNYYPSQKNIELVPVLEQPKTLRQFFRTYQLIAVSPFIAVRSGLMISAIQSHTYVSLRWIIQVANLLTLVYISYIAAALYQPEYLLLYLVGFSLWILFALFTYPGLSTSEKITYLLLAPATVGYFLVNSIVAPLRVFNPFRIANYVSN